MKFDKYLSEITKNFLVEMPVAMYSSDKTAGWDKPGDWLDPIQTRDPKNVLASTKTGPERKAQKQKVLDKFKKTAADFWDQYSERATGGDKQDVIYLAQQATRDTYEDLFDKIGEQLLDYLLPNGYNPAINAKHLLDTLNVGELLDIIRNYLKESDVEPDNVRGINDSYAKHTSKKLIQVLFGEFGQGKYAGDVNIDPESTPSYDIVKRGFDYRSARGAAHSYDTTPIDLHDPEEERKAFESKQMLQEMPYIPHPSYLKKHYGGDINRGKEMFIDKVTEALLQKHARINDPYNRRGSQLYHAGKTAQALYGKNVENLTEQQITPILKAYLGAVYEVVFKDNKSLAKDKGYLRAAFKEAVKQSRDRILDELKQISGTVPDNIEQAFEALGNTDSDLDYFARIAQNAAVESFAVLKIKESSDEEMPKSDDEEEEESEDENKVPVEEQTEPEEEDDDDEEDDDGSSEYAYNKGLLDDEEESEEDENKEEDEADAAVQRLERAGTDIASIFLKSIDAVDFDDDEEDDEGWDEGDETLNGEEEDWRNEFRGRGYVRDDMEDEENYDPSSDIFGRNYDEE